MSKRRSPQQWRSILSSFHRSGQTQVQFCSEHGLCVATLRYQLSRERSRSDDSGARPSSSPRLLEVTPVGATAVQGNCPGESDQVLRVECSLDSRVVSIDCRPDQLAQLLTGLSSFHHRQRTGP